MTNLSLSDILRHIITGAFFFLFSLLAVKVLTTFSLNMLEKKDVFWLIIILVCYPLGIIFQGINKIMQDESEYKLINYVGKKLFRRYSIKQICIDIKAGKEKNAPDWIQTSMQPEKIVEHMEMEIENKKTANINEYFYFCELFQGLYD